MRKRQFDKLVDVVVSAYSSKCGVIARLSKCSKPEKAVNLCVSTIRNNRYIIPEKCLLWDDDVIMYEGNLASSNLFSVLESLHLTKAEITDARKLESNKGDIICLGACKRCSLKCNYRTDSYLQYITEKYPILKQDDCIDTAVIQAYKKSKRQVQRETESARDLFSRL